MRKLCVNLIWLGGVVCTCVRRCMEYQVKVLDRGNAIAAIVLSYLYMHKQLLYTQFTHMHPLGHGQEQSPIPLSRTVGFMLEYIFAS